MKNIKLYQDHLRESQATKDTDRLTADQIKHASKTIEELKHILSHRRFNGRRLFKVGLPGAWGTTEDNPEAQDGLSVIEFTPFLGGRDILAVDISERVGDADIEHMPTPFYVRGIWRLMTGDAAGDANLIVDLIEQILPHAVDFLHGSPTSWNEDVAIERLKKLKRSRGAFGRF